MAKKGERLKLANGCDCPAMRRKLFEKLLRHIESGLSVNCFKAMSPCTIKKYLTEYPEWDEDELEEAKRVAMGFWEDLGRRQADGSCMGNSRSWYYNMAHRYGWSDKVVVEATHKGDIAVNVVSYASVKRAKDSLSAS